MTFYRSLAFKNAIIYLIIFLTGIGIMGYLLLDNSSKRIIQTAENQLLHSGDLVEIQLVEYIERLVSNMDFLSKSPVLLRYLSKSDQENYDLLAKEFLTLIESNGDFSQIRFLNAEEGLEIVRVDQRNRVSEIIPKSFLQIKKDRMYFKSSLNLDPSDIYFSPINLNKEFGKISVPYTPTLRVARPIYYDNRLEGVIVINTDLTNLFLKLEKSVGDNFTLRIVNDEGYYLLHEKNDSTFIFEFDAQKRQVTDDLLSQENKLIKLPNELVSIHRTKVKHLKYDFICHIIANKAQLLRPYFQWRDRSILLIVIIAFLFSTLTFLLLRRQSKNLIRLTNSMRQFPEKRKVSELPINRKDEIGDLARGFKDMAGIINDQMESIESEKLKAESAEKEKSNFIENISHEIRNPLQSIIGLSNILEQNKLNPNQVDILKSIKFNTSNLNALVNSILDYQNVINGNIKPEKIWTDVNSLIHELTIGKEYAAIQKSIALIKMLDERLDSLEVEIDRLRISQILSNLISNAITHTPSKGEIIVGVYLVSTIDDRAILRFTITDNGVGMTQTELTRIKERYFTKNKDRQLYANFGLGLTIVNELLGLMDTQLNIESIKDEGSIFSFEVDALIRNKEVKEKEVSDYKNSFADLKTLIIDDDDQILELYKFYFDSSKTLFVKSLAGLNNRSSETYDIIISDWRFANDILSDHIEILSSISTSNTSLVVISGAKPDLSLLESIFPELMFVRKPINREALFQTISEGRLCLQFGKPIVENIKKDYDYDQSKYKKAIMLLLDEWKIYNGRLAHSIRNNDIEELEEILHKFNNTLRRLNLYRFEEYLVLTKEKMKTNVIDTEKESLEIIRVMDLYYGFIKSYYNR